MLDPQKSEQPRSCGFRPLLVLLVVGFMVFGIFTHGFGLFAENEPAQTTTSSHGNIGPAAPRPQSNSPRTTLPILITCDQDKTPVGMLIAALNDIKYFSQITYHVILGSNKESDCITTKDADTRRAAAIANMTARRDVRNDQIRAAVTQLNNRVAAATTDTAAEQINIVFEVVCTSPEAGKYIDVFPVVAQSQQPSHSALPESSLPRQFQGDYSEQVYVPTAPHRIGELDTRGREIFNQERPFVSIGSSQLATMPWDYDSAAQFMCGTRLPAAPMPPHN